MNKWNNCFVIFKWLHPFRLMKLRHFYGVIKKRMHIIQRTNRKGRKREIKTQCK